MTSSKPIGIELFAGAGGLSHGLSQAGFDMKLGLEIDPESARTLKENHKTMTVVQADIKTTDPLKIIKKAGLKPKDIDLISGGPPCRGFSQSNKRSRNLDNPLNSLYKDFFRYVKEIKPTIFLMENVSGIETLEEGIVIKDIEHLCKKLDYQLHHRIISSEKFGVPQKRRRKIFIGTKDKTDQDFFEVKKTKLLLVKEAIDDLPAIENGNRIDTLEYARNNKLSDYQKAMRGNKGISVANNQVTRNSDLVLNRYKYISQGGNWKQIPARLMHNYKNRLNCHGYIYYRLPWNKPSVVISNFRKNMLIHPEKHRGLSVREAARLQSFQDNYKFYGFLGSQQQQVANAVPPLMSKKIGINIVKHLEGG
jgi:DNA (cytosine-5)-methyltransferase 1